MATAVGVKGSDVYTSLGLGNFMVALSSLLVRGVDVHTVEENVNKILECVLDDPREPEVVEELFVLAFQTRDIRGGKGERDASRHVFEALLNSPLTSSIGLDLLDLIPEYGCWQDLFKLSPIASSRIKEIVKGQIEQDELALSRFSQEPVWGWGGQEPENMKPHTPKLSLLAKWMPREGQPGASEMAALLVPGTMFQGARMKQYRKRLSALNKALKTVEVPMCAKQWSHIVPAAVPGRAAKKYVKAFLNEKGTTRKGQVAAAGVLRHPDNQDRMECRQHFQEHFSKTASGEVKAKGADTLFPHEVVKKAFSLLNGNEYNSDDSHASKQDGAEFDHLRGVWRAMVDAAKSGGGLGRSLAMCDFSGSMTCSGSNGDTPYWVSMALGLLISEVTTEEFKNTFLTFDSTPQIHTLPEGDLFTKLTSFDPSSISQGTSTDFQKAMDLVLARCKAARVKPGQEPENLIVLTDMAWDQACGSADNNYRNVVKTEGWQTHVEMIREAFKRAGEDMWGEGQGLKMPTIVIWNIASTCQDFHATATTPGVVMLSGWSPSLFKVLQTKGVVQITPEEALKIQLEDARYDLVRARVRRFFH